MKIKLGQALEYEQPTKYIVASEKYKDEYETPVLTAGKSFILGYTNETDGIYTNLPVIIFDDFTTDIKFVDFPFKVKSSAMKMLQPSSEEYNLKFFYYLIKFMNFQPTSHQRHWISKFAEFEFDIPTKEKQDEIVEKLDKLCEMLALKEKELKKYDDLVKSQFIEMFGNFEKELNFSDVLIDETKHGYKFDSKYYNSIGQIAIVDQSENYICGYKNLEQDKKPYANESIIFGDHTERFKYVNFPYYLGADGVKILKCNSSFNTVFVYWFMLINYIPVGGYSRHFKYLKELLFIKPSIELQNQFADFVKHIDKLKFTIKESIEKLNLCYQSLMKEYFE